MQQIAIRRGILVVGLVIGSFLVTGAGAASAQEDGPVVSILPTTTNERSDLSQPGLPCKPPEFFPGGYTGPCYLNFNVVVHNPSGIPVEATVAFEFGTATVDDVEELPDPVTVTIQGQNRTCGCVVVADDSLIEPDETIIATIISASGAEIGQASAAGTILDDEPAAHPPTVDVVGSGNSSVTLGWDPVEPVRGTLTGYTVVAVNETTPAIVAEQRVAPDVERVSVADLDPTATYTFDVRAETTDGPGAEATVSGAPDAAGPPPALADAPTVVDTVEGDGFVTVDWVVPPDDGGAPIVAYSVVALDPDDSSLVAWRNLASDARQASLPDLANGEPVDLVVLAWNQAGPSATPAATLTPSPGTASEAPAASPYIQVDSHSGTATVHWGQAPERGLPVLGYSVVVTEDIHGTTNLVEWRNVGPDVRSVEIDDLNFCFYDVHVVAFGATGFGDVAVQPDLVIAPGETGGQGVCLNPPG